MGDVTLKLTSAGRRLFGVTNEEDFVRRGARWAAGRD